jgi:hypothetical protein
MRWVWLMQRIVLLRVRRVLPLRRRVFRMVVVRACVTRMVRALLLVVLLVVLLKGRWLLLLLLLLLLRPLWLVQVIVLLLLRLWQRRRPVPLRGGVELARTTSCRRGLSRPPGGGGCGLWGRDANALQHIAVQVRVAARALVGFGREKARVLVLRVWVCRAATACRRVDEGKNNAATVAQLVFDTTSTGQQPPPPQTADAC